MNKGLIARLQLAGSYGFLVTLLIIVIFPFYWMTVTSFKGEDQMRSLVSMFWPIPFASCWSSSGMNAVPIAPVVRRRPSVSTR